MKSKAGAPTAGKESIEPVPDPDPTPVPASVENGSKDDEPKSYAESVD